MTKHFQNLWGKVVKIQLRLKTLLLQCLQTYTGYRVLILVAHIEEIKLYFLLKQRGVKEETHIRLHANIEVYLKEKEIGFGWPAFAPVFLTDEIQVCCYVCFKPLRDNEDSALLIYIYVCVCAVCIYVYIHTFVLSMMNLLLN